MQAKELWFTENYCPDARFSMRVERQVYSAKSRFQQIDVYDTPAFGRVLVLDGCLMLTEKDEFIYHEMIVHPAMAVKPDIKSVLVIGGGDGGCIRELAKYNSIEKIDLCEIDREVIKVCREFLPQTSLRMDDIRAELHIADGSSTATASPPSRRTAFSSISTKAPTTPRTRWPASGPTGSCTPYSARPGFTRPTSPPTPPATGCSGSPPSRGGTRGPLTGKPGTRWGLRPGITTPICIRGASRCRIM